MSVEPRGQLTRAGPWSRDLSLADRGTRANLDDVFPETAEEAQHVVALALRHLEMIERRLRVVHENGPVLVVDLHALVGFPHVSSNVERGPTRGLDHKVDDQLARLATVVDARAFPEILESRIALQTSQQIVGRRRDRVVAAQALVQGLILFVVCRHVPPSRVCLGVTLRQSAPPYHAKSPRSYSQDNSHRPNREPRVGSRRSRPRHATLTARNGDGTTALGIWRPVEAASSGGRTDARETGRASALSARTISDLERGVSRRPRRDTVEVLAHALQLTQPERTALEAAAWSAAVAMQDSRLRDANSGSLPLHLTSFVGREEELRTTRDLLRRGGARLVTLTGPGGAGKSRLAVRVAAEVMGEFRDGARYVELAPVADTDEVLPAIARALGLARPDAAAHIADVVDAVRDTELLLVVDNFEHLLTSAPLLSALLRGCPGLNVIVTSRASLQLSGEHELTVPPLAVPPPDPTLSAEAIAEYASVRLFVDRAGYVNPSFALRADNALTVAAICARLDGLPLALELAAARTKLLTPHALLQRLDSAPSGSALRLLTRGARDVPPRQRTLRDTMLWSYNLLTPDEQRLLRRLSIFAGGCTLTAAEVVCRPDPAMIDRGADSAREIFDGLASLLDKSLVYLHEGPDGEQRFMLLETVREFGLDQSRAIGEMETVARAHARYYLELVEATGALLFAGAPRSAGPPPSSTICTTRCAGSSTTADDGAWMPENLPKKPCRARASGGPGDVCEQVEEGLLPVSIDPPVDRHELVAVHVVARRSGAAGACAGVEIAPRRVRSERGDEVVRGTVELEVVVFIEHNRLARVASEQPGALDLVGDQRWIGRPVAVE